MDKIHTGSFSSKMQRLDPLFEKPFVWTLRQKTTYQELKRTAKEIFSHSKDGSGKRGNWLRCKVTAIGWQMKIFHKVWTEGELESIPINLRQPFLISETVKILKPPLEVI